MSVANDARAMRCADALGSAGRSGRLGEAIAYCTQVVPVLVETE